MNVFTVKKKCTAMYTTMLLSLIAQNELKRGKRRQGFLIYQWNHIQIYSYDASIITLNRWQEGREEKDRDGNKCVCALSHTGMNSVSVEPNVPPIKVYWDQVVLVSLKVKADLYNQTWG